MSFNHNPQRKSALRVGFLINSFIQPRWFCKLIDDLEAASSAELVIVMLIDQSAHMLGKPVDTIGKQRDHWVYKAYCRVDDFLFPVAKNAAENVNIKKTAADLFIVPVCPVQEGNIIRFLAEDMDKIQAQKLDVILYFGDCTLDSQLLGSARYGVWSIGYGENYSHWNGLSGFWEVLKDAPATKCDLYMRNAHQDGLKVIARSYLPTQKNSLRRQQNNLYWKSAALVTKKLEEIYEYGPLALDDRRFSSDNEIPEESLTQRNLLLALVRLGRRSAYTKLQNLFLSKQWVLAFYIGRWPNGIQLPVERLRILISPEGHDWADPFPVKKDDRYFVFFEELAPGESKGHIAMMEIEPNGNQSRPAKVLEAAYHLSFPYIFEWQENYYMVPETSQNRTIELYRSNSFPYEWHLERVLLEGVVALDTTLTEINGRWWMFTHIREDAFMKNHDELHLFYAETPLGPWMPHRRNPVKMDTRSARPAGRIFGWKGDLYRPAQDCSRRYGYAISINRIDQIDESCYLETEVSKILPNWSKNIVATHTINAVDGFLVIDGKLSRPKLRQFTTK